MTLEELSFLLWATQGVQARLSHETVLKTVPSAGGLHALETYLCILRVTGVPGGLYRYLPLEHQLLEKFRDERLGDKLVGAVSGQSFVRLAAVTFVWTTVPYRMEWRYGQAAHKFIAMESGHACQNLYLACEAIGAGTCAVAVYNQDALDRLLEVDGKDEFAIYLAPVGKTGRQPAQASPQG
jgi:SagB-type dehydrogenase family enzyme